MVYYLCRYLCFFSVYYLRYSTNIYQTNAQVKILKDEGGLDLSGLQGGSPLIDMSKVNLENEREILKSRRIAKKVVDSAKVFSLLG